MAVSILRNGYGRMRRGLRHAKVFAFTLGMAALPLVALADEDDAPVPLDPQTKAAQNWTFGIIALLVVLAIAWYRWRIWQIRRSGNSIEGLDRGQE